MFEHVIEGCQCQGKQCTACPPEQNVWCIGMFPRNKGMPDGLLKQCKACVSKKQKEWYNRPEVYERRRVQRKQYYNREREHIREHRSQPEARQHHIAYMRDYHNHPDTQERIRHRRKAYRSRPEVQAHERAYRKVYETTRAPEIRERSRPYKRAYEQRMRQNYPDKMREKGRRDTHLRRARKRAAPGTYTPQQIKEQYTRQKGKCYYCHKKVKWEDRHIDHVIPLSRGGSNDISNLVIACPTCNLRKRNKLPHEFFEGGKLL